MLQSTPYKNDDVRVSSSVEEPLPLRRGGKIRMMRENQGLAPDLAGNLHAQILRDKKRCNLTQPRMSGIRLHSNNFKTIGIEAQLLGRSNLRPSV